MISMAKIKTQRQRDIDAYVDIVMNPRKYIWICNVPGTFEAAEDLYWNLLEHEVPKRVARRVDEVLIRSGHYFHVNNLEFHSEGVEFLPTPYGPKWQFIELT